jgi:SNF family Na+-dependent transporter
LGGISLLESLDSVLVDYMLPILALVVSLAALFLLPVKSVQREFAATEIDQEISHFHPIWRAVILWVAPIVVISALLIRIVGELVKMQVW